MNPVYYCAPAAAGLYCIARTLPLIRNRSPRCKALVTALIALSFLAYPLAMLASLSRPWSSVWLPLQAAGLLFSAGSLFAGLLLARDILLLLALPARLARARRERHSLSFSERPPKRDKALPAALAALACLALAGWGTYETQKSPPVLRTEITLERLPAELDGLRIAQVTDTHASPLFRRERFRKIIEATNALQPDFTFVTGDIADGTPEARAGDVAPIRGLAAREGVLLIPGNHDYYVDYVGWVDHYRSLGLTVLENESRTYTVRGKNVTVAGLADRTGALYGFSGPRIDVALAGAEPDALRIALVHRPVNAAAQADPRWGVDLQLSGHTHGAQNILLRPLIAMQNDGYVSGLYRVGGMALYVSNGLGVWSGPPARIFAPAEITLVTLRAASPGK